MSTSTYRLRTCVRVPQGEITAPNVNVTFPAPNDADAIVAARNHPVHFFADHSDYAWLTNENDKVIWSLKLEES